MKALNVDDKDDNLYFLEAVMRSVGFEVINAHNGVEALALLETEEVDIIVSDVLMPVMDGFHFCREVRKNPKWAKTPFVFYTGSYTNLRDQELALRTGANRYLIKPMEPSKLTETLLEVMAESAKQETHAPPVLTDESEYLRSYSERLVQKLEEKVAEFDALSRRLQTAFDEKVMEVAERLHVEDALRFNEERYRAVVSSLAEGILLADGAGQIVACNDSASAILNVPKSQILVSSLDQPLWMAVGEDGHTLPPEKHPLSICLREGHPLDKVVMGVRRTQGDTIWLSANVRLCQRDPKGKTTLAVMSFSDITAQRAAQEHIKEQAHIIDQSHDAIMLCDAEGTVRYWNKGAERLYGWSSEEALGHCDWELFGRAIIPLASPIKKTLKEGSFEGEFRHITKDDRELIVHGRLAAVKEKEGSETSVLGFYFDITEKKSLEEKFMRAQRLESIGILAGGVAHDLNNILAPILLAVPIVRMRVNDPQGIMLLDTMEASATRGAQIVRQILTFSRGLRTEKMAIQARHLLKEIAELTQETFPPNISIETDLPRNLWMVEADTTQLHQVFLNLCVNARDAMPHGGCLTLRGENVVLDEAACAQIPQSRCGNFAKLSVIDNGTGISNANIKRMFEPFFTTKDPGKGTGLGLSTARSIVEQHQGFIWLESTPGEGTRFDVYLPGIQSTEEATPVFSRDLPHGKGELLIVVDDEFAMRHICENLLTAHDYRVLTADSGQQGLAHLRANYADVAMVITDLLMPGMSGADLIPLIRGMKPQVKVVAISGTVSSSSETMAPPGVIADAFLNKPFAAEQLLLTVHEVLSEKR